jgi:hypothetical protein
MLPNTISAHTPLLSSATAAAACHFTYMLLSFVISRVHAGASEAENLCYMERLGLWGPGSAFPSKQEFVGLLKQVCTVMKACRWL